MIINSYRFKIDELKAYYPFNGNADDESGNGNDGTVFGATLTTDRDATPNSAYSFDGNDYISCGSSLGDFQGNFYIEFWFTTTSSDLRIALSKFNVDSGNYWYIRQSGGKIGIVTVTPDDSLTFENTTVINDGDWHKAIIEFDGVNVNISIDDGTPQSSDFSSFAGYTTGADFRISGIQVNANFRWVGKLDDIKIK